MKKAVALRYHKGVPAPFVTAKAAGDLAEKMVRLAEEFDVPLVEHSIAVDSLFTLEVDQFIPEELYEIVVELLLFAGYIEKSSGKGEDEKH